MQCGGVPGLGTEFLVIAVSMFQERAKARGESICFLYVDATQAFYAVLRCLVAAVIESDEAVANLFAQLKLPASALDELRTILAQGPCLNHSDINQATKRDIASTFSACHFTVRGRSLLGGANSSTRPGHSYADVVFSYAFHQILESITVDLDHAGVRPLVPTAACNEATSTFDTGVGPMPIVAFFDDIVVPIVSKTPGAFRA